MKPADRQQLYDVLMKDSLEACGGDPGRLVVLDEIVTGDLDVLEPVIDKIIAREKEEMLAKLSRMGWEDGDLAIEVVPRGVECIVHIRFGETHALVHIARTRLANIGQFLMLEAAK